MLQNDKFPGRLFSIGQQPWTVSAFIYAHPVARDSIRSGQQTLCCVDYTGCTHCRANRFQLEFRANPIGIVGRG